MAGNGRQATTKAEEKFCEEVLGETLGLVFAFFTVLAAYLNTAITTQVFAARCLFRNQNKAKL